MKAFRYTNPKPSLQDIFSMAFCGIWKFPSRSQRDLQTSIILFQSRCTERSLIKTRLLNPAGRLLSSGDVRRGAQTDSVCLTFIESVTFCRSGPSAVCASFQKRCAVECVQHDQALFFFYQQLNASASCSFLVLRFTFVRLHRYDSLHAAAHDNCSDSSAKFAIVPTKIPVLDCLSLNTYKLNRSIVSTIKSENLLQTMYESSIICGQWWDQIKIPKYFNICIL